jgi:calcineurin-like phosphoesterase family protein
MIFFTADMHFGHKNIIEFCDRPFRDLAHMNEGLIRNWNERVGVSDTVYHVGDFAFKGGWQGAHNNPDIYEAQLHGNIVHILGNHDRNNHLRNSIYQARIKFAGREWILQHHPPKEDELEVGVHYIVGHVHEKWRFKRYGDTIIMNVGVDVNNYRPVKLYELIVAVDRFTKASEND